MLPKLYNIPSRSHLAIDRFKGINLTNSYESGELTDCVNITSEAYPAVGTRQKRTLCLECDGDINGIGSFDGYFCTYYKTEPDGIFLNFKGKVYEFTAISNSKDFASKRKFACLENAILIIPDNVIFNVDTLTFKTAELRFKANYNTAKEKFLGEYNSPGLYSPTSASGIGTISTNSILSLKTVYAPVGSTKYEFYPSAFPDNIEANDVVVIKMETFCPDTSQFDNYRENMNKFKAGLTLTVKEVEKLSHKLPDGRSITEIISLTFYEDVKPSDIGYRVYYSEISIEKVPPAFTHITSHNNRIWGIAGNKVYASRLGDADEWNDFSIDSFGTKPSASFVASAGTDGGFTGIIPHGNYIYALKENYIHKIYGDSPDEYTISNISAPGCKNGSDTLCICGMYIMYASNDGICILREGYPKIISQKIGSINPICAAAESGKFYALCRTDNGRCIYVYDQEHDIWLKESCADNADNLCADRKSVCYSEGCRMIYLSQEDGGEWERDVHWQFRMRFDSKGFCGSTAINAMAKISLSKNSSFTARVIYDDATKGGICGFCYDETQYGSTVLRFPVKKDSGFSVEFKGVGGFELRNIKFNFYKSSEE